MNNLNSVLIEGKLTNVPAWNPELQECKMKISSVREDETLLVDIMYSGKKALSGQKGQGVRVVGRLSQAGKKLVIIAEYIEFWPK